MCSRTNRPRAVGDVSTGPRCRREERRLSENAGARDRLLIPGLVNAHTHAHGALERGWSPTGPPWRWAAWSGAALGPRGVEEKYLSAQLSAIEMVHKGCTAAYDMCVEYPAPTVDGVRAVARPTQTSGCARWWRR